LNLRKSKARIGYKHWLQNELGNVLIEYGIRRTKEMLVEAFNARTSSATTPSDSVTIQQKTSVVKTTVAPPVLRDQSNVTGGDSGHRRSGRPIKKKRRGGRPPAAKKVGFTQSLTHTSHRTPPPTLIHLIHRSCLIVRVQILLKDSPLRKT